MPQLIPDPQPPPDREQKRRYEVTHASPLILVHIFEDSFALDHNAGLLESCKGSRTADSYSTSCAVQLHTPLRAVIVWLVAGTQSWVCPGA